MSICTRRSGTYMEQLDYLVGAERSKAIMWDDRIRALGDAWQRAIGNVSGAECCARV